jgi:hypothetical protein
MTSTTTKPGLLREARLPEYALVTLLVAVALAARLVPGARTIDDAYITFRYARNIVNGEGFVYNPGDAVLGTTTPLYTLLLAVLSAVSRWRDFPTLAVALNALAGAASVALLYAVGKRVVNHWAPPAAAALLWAVAPFSVAFAVGGMETDVTIALLLGTAYAYVTDASYALAVLSALALLARPDTALLLILLWIGLVLRSRRIPIWEGMTALGVLAPWLVFATVSFGSPVPASLAAKSAAYRLPPTADLVRLIQHYSTPFLEHDLLGSRWQLLGFVVYLVLVSLGGLHTVRRERPTWPLLVYPYLYLVAFSAANPLLFRWYLAPPLPFYFLFVLTGVWVIGRDIDRLVGGADQEPSQPLSCCFVMLAAFTVVALAATLSAWELHPDHGPDRPAPEMAWIKLELLYARAADLVLQHAEPGDALCAGDIGTLGYFTDMPILGTVGLVTPDARQYYPADPEIYVINYAIPADLVLTLEPDFVVILEVYGRHGLLPAPRFQDRYSLVRELDTTIYGSDGMLIFQRN